MEEIWKEIPTYEGKYLVSTLGQVKSLHRRVMRSTGSPITIKGKILEERDNGGCRYNYVYLTTNSVPKNVRIHVIVWKTFNGEIPNMYAIAHKNGNFHDNRLSNLMLINLYEDDGTYMHDRYMKKFGSYKVQSKLTLSQVYTIKWYRRLQLPLKYFRDQFPNVQRVTLYSVLSGRSWKWV